MTCRKDINIGFTLIEVLVAISIFSLAIVGLLSVVATSQRNFIESKLNAKAMFLAEQKMNEIFRIGYQVIEEDDKGYYLDESDEENPVELIIKEGEFYNEYDEGTDISEEWMEDYCWQAIIKESEEFVGMQMVMVKVFNKNFSGEDEFSENGYGVMAELVTYISATKASQEKKEKKDE